MIQSPLFEEIRKYLQNRCDDDSILFLFVPYIKKNVLEELLDGIMGRKIIVTTWNPSDLQSGSSDLDLWPFCSESGITLYVSKRLHLKIYSAGLKNAILATGNISNQGLMHGGNYEAAVLLEQLSNKDRLFLEKIQRDSRLVGDTMYEKLKKWLEEHPTDLQKEILFEDIVPVPTHENFLISALPMTQSMDDLVDGYQKITKGEEPSANSETAACIFHDLTNYGIEPGLEKTEFLKVLSDKFFEHPFVQKIDEFIAPEAYFGRIKEWIQNNCTDVPVPSRRELTSNVQVLLEWFVEIGNGKYEIDVPGRHSQRIRKLYD